MHKAMLDVAEFHVKMKQDIGDPRSPDVTVNTQLRHDLIHEEFEELTEALQGKDMSHEEQVIAVADALGDMAYVICGAALTWGIDLGGVFDAIHRSNMTKKAENKREDGKVLKDKDYHPPNIKGALDNARLECDEYGFGEDSFWPQPTYTSQFQPWTLSAKAQQPHDRLHEAMKSIDRDIDCFEDAKTSEYVAPRDTEPTPLADPYSGVFLSRGAFIFECPCGRRHEVSTKAGSRGGMADTGHAECVCGKVYDVYFDFDGTKNIASFEVTDLGGIHV
jgi:predicted HAD superfamily Cof-like phosphohydrolase